MAVVSPRSGDLLAPGQHIGPFLLLTPLGAGGAGRVWAVARTGQLGFTKRMVLKVMRQDKLRSERARQRFDREARLGAQLRHAHVRGVHEVGVHAGRPYMALSWVDASLSELLEHAPGRRLEPSVACWLALQTSDGLAAAHRYVNHAQQPCPIVHGDVSPGNILLTAQGHVLLADLAGTVDPSAPRSGESASEEAAPQRFFGSLGYASPEALRGLPLDGRADVFSLGCVLYEMLCGSPPFEADDERSIIYQVLEREPPDVRQRAPEVPAELAVVVARALKRRVEERFQSAEELRAALLACVRGLSAFRLEERSASLIQQVLGARIRAREDEMRGVFQRFSASQFERTDTLPILASAADRTSSTLRAGGADSLAESAAGVSRSEALGLRPKPGRLGFWAVLLAALALVGGYAVTGLQRARRLEVASPSPPASERGAPELRQQALRGPPPVAGGAGASSAGERPQPAPESSEEPSVRRPDDGAPGSAGASAGPGPEPATAPRQRAGTRRAPSAGSPSAPAEPAASEPSTAPARPFEWDFPEDPYESLRRPSAPKPASKPPAQPR